MLFSSLVFLFYFLPILLVTYFIVPKSAKNLVLLIFSILFHAWGGISYTSILFGSILLNYLVAKQLSRKKSSSKSWLIAGITFNVLLLISFKYLLFFIENLNAIILLMNEKFVPFGGINIILPLGISFFTFQQMSMLWDIYREKEAKKITFLDTALYVSFFPQLIAGPIVRYNDIIQDLKVRKESVELFYSGSQRFIIGLFKKVVIANGCGLIIDTMLKEDLTHLNAPMAWLGIVCYAFQIFFDFSGYSDMAIGLGRMFGFKILENFNFPYIAKNIQDFWRRWHISLSTWFRDYVYIPLGGNRKGFRKTYTNLFLVFLLTGFWHGATWSFVFWGVFHGFFIIIERLFLGKLLLRIPSFIGWIYTILVVLIGWVFFRIADFSDALYFIGKMFSLNSSGNLSVFEYLDQERLIILSLAILFSIPWSFFKNIFFPSIEKDHLLLSSIRSVILLAAFFYSIVLLTAESYNPFIYFNF